MSLEYAVERLYDLGWAPTPGRLTQRLEDGRAYPATADVLRAFGDAGLTLKIRHVALFNCHRAEWAGGYTVGATEAEAAVFALAHLIKDRDAVSVAR